MQDIYAFDIGDFGKIGLLRQIHRVTNLRLGVLWWRTTLGTDGNDGRHVGYLANARFRACDADLWEDMRRVFNPHARTIDALHPLLPDGTLFHSEDVPSFTAREPWLCRAMDAVRGSQIAFCDPDNGVDFKGPCRSPRHIGIEEIRTLYRAGSSLVIYHTPDRSMPHVHQISTALDRLRHEVAPHGGVWAAHFRRGSSRVFLVLAQPRHAAVIGNALDRMRTSSWVRHGHFTISEPGEWPTEAPDLSPPAPPVPAPASRAIVHAGAPENNVPGVNRRIRVVLNDNGGLNTAANPWLRDIELPCVVRGQGLDFIVTAHFRGRRDMFRVSPSTLSIARHLSFTGDHLSHPARVEFDATINVPA